MRSWSIAAPAACVSLHQNKAGRIYVLAVTQLEISSTDLRQLIYANRDLRYLVPDAVRELIVTTGCYAQQ